MLYYSKRYAKYTFEIAKSMILGYRHLLFKAA